jgi:prepilin-type N-terminal cleavage/methylation domain-containing protein
MRKKGYSLTELLVVMGMTSVILTAGVGMVHRVMREQKAAERDNATHRVAQRLTTKLRDDVHYANRATLTESDDEGEQALVLHQTDERIVTYAAHKNEVRWTSIQEGEPTRRDSFRFPGNYRLQFSEVSGQRVTLTAFALPQAYLATADGTSNGAEIESEVRRAVMHVEAAVGRDHRFLIETKE